MTIEHSISTQRYALCALAVSAVLAVLVTFTGNWRLSEQDVPPDVLIEETSQPFSSSSAQSAVPEGNAFEDGLVVSGTSGFSDTRILPTTGTEITMPDHVGIAASTQRAMQAGHSNERMEAIAALGDSQDPLAVLTLRSLLDDPIPSVREEAVESLGAIGGTSGVAGLGYALSDENIVVRRIAIETLAELATDDAVDALAWTLNEKNAELRELAADELADIDSDMSLALLQRFLADDDYRVRQIATKHLATARSDDDDLR